MGYGQSLNFRCASMEDAPLLFKWANDKETRKNSFHTEAIPYEEHAAWCRKKLSSPDTLMLIASVMHDAETISYPKCAQTATDTISHANVSLSASSDPTEIGLLRLEKEYNLLVISYVVAPDYRGQGFGFALLRDGLAYEETHRVLSAHILRPAFYAEVKPQNTASSRIFEKLGFTLTENTEDCLRYQRPLFA